MEGDSQLSGSLLRLQRELIFMDTIATPSEPVATAATSPVSIKPPKLSEAKTVPGPGLGTPKPDRKEAKHSAAAGLRGTKADVLAKIQGLPLADEDKVWLAAKVNKMTGGAVHLDFHLIEEEKGWRVHGGGHTLF